MSLVLALFVACATTGAHSAGAAPPVPPESLAMRPTPPPPPPGSLYSDVGGRALIGMDNNARRVGDLVTVLVNEADSTSMSANTALQRRSSTSAEISALFGLRKAILDANPNMGGTLGLGGSSGSETTGDGETSRQGSLSAVLTCKITEVLANGNLQIWGQKEIRVNGETQYLTLTGEIRPRDLRLDNTVQSSLIFGSKVEFTGKGDLASQQHQGWGTTVTNAIWPF